jgi:hypothetical protein
MPFPLAHPAAVLPFRRWCPRYLDFVALVIGSLVPDLASSINDLEYFSHTLLGSFVLCLPLGLLTVWLFRQVRDPLIATLPNPHREVALSFRPWRVVPLVQVVFSLLLGIWLHIFWDLFTHDHSWIVRRGLLSSFVVAGMPLNKLLWLLSSLIGSVTVLIAYFLLVRRRTGGTEFFPQSERHRYFLWMGILIIPIAAAVPLALVDPTYSHGAFLRFFAMYYFSCAYLTLVIVGFAMRYRHAQNAAKKTQGQIAGDI